MLLGKWVVLAEMNDKGDVETRVIQTFKRGITDASKVQLLGALQFAVSEYVARAREEWKGAKVLKKTRDLLDYLASATEKWKAEHGVN